MSTTIPASVKVATLVMIVMLKSTSVSPPLAFAVSTLVGNTKQRTSWSLTLAQNNSEHLDFDGSFKTILFHLMLLSWYQKTPSHW